MDLNQPSIITLLNGKETMEYDEQLADKITLLAAQINAATYLFLKLIGEFDRRAGWAGDGIRSCAHWLDWKCGIAGCAARERVRIAHCLDELPLINKAFEAGEVSYSKVRAMTRVATNDNEEYLLMIAQHGTASHIAKLVRKYRRVEKNMDLEQLEALQQSREFTSFQDADGMWEIRARLPQDEGGLVIKAIDEIMRQQDKPLNKPLGYVEENVSAETNSPEPEIMETCNFPQKRADAFCAMAEHYLASATDENPKTLAGHERCQIVLHLDVETLKHEHCCEHSGCNDHRHQKLAETYSQDGIPAKFIPEDGVLSPSMDSTSPEQRLQAFAFVPARPHSLGGQWIDPKNAKRLSCDASLLTVLEDEDGNVLNIASKTRTIPPLLKRALDIRDTTCKFPGCCQSYYVDFHHIKHWANEGETKKGNLIKLCRFHHRALHNSLFDIEAQGDENNPTFIFKTATGKVMEANPKLPQTEKTTVAGAIKDFERQWPNINARTGRTLWQGEGMDYSMGVDSLLNRRNGPVDYK